MLVEIEKKFDIKFRKRFWTVTKPYGVRFDMLAWFQLAKELGIELDQDAGQMFGKLQFDEVVSMAVYAGGLSYCFEHKQTVWFTREEVLKWVDESIITRGQMREIGTMWVEFIRTFASEAEKKNKEKSNQ